MVVNAPKRMVYNLADPRVQFSMIAAVLLCVLWITTLSMISLEHSNAEQVARLSTVEIAETYEAQMIRALREIDQTLTLVAYMAGLQVDLQGDLQGQRLEQGAILDELNGRGLLPPNVLFTITLTDINGEPLASTGALDSLQALDMAALTAIPDGDTLHVSQPRFDETNQRWWLDFSRVLVNTNGVAIGAVTVAADAEYFVSGYESAQLGGRGLLAVLGADGQFRVRRSGEDVQFGGAANLDAWLAESEFRLRDVPVLEHPWDGEQRYTNARTIFGFPLTLMIGLSVEERHALANEQANTYVWRAVIASLVVLIVTGLLGRLSAQLYRARAIALEEQIAHAQQVEYLAFHDSLTDLPNRSFFVKLLHQRILDARRNHKKFAVMFLDIDKFKAINDTLGHDAGDQLLKEVAQRIRAALRESDVVARMGGDEFTIILPDTSDEEQLIEASRKILALVRKNYILSGQELRITVSIGVSVYPRDGEDEESLMKRADIAMYHAKEEGRNNFKFYTDEINTHSLERLTLEASLRHAIQRKELHLYYQAKRDLSTDRITGMEALLRWQHPDLGLILPKQFIPIAEETGLIVPIGRWVLEHACRQSVAWREKGINLGMAVNLSPVQFRDEKLLSDLERMLLDTGMNPDMLELEITESMIMSDMPRAVSVMQGMKCMGIRIAIDDFGTGYSSLAALKDFSIDTIKIDGSFIIDIVANKESQGLATAIIAMGRTLGLNVVAEGVESKAQMDYLKSGVCNEFQGFYLNVPMPSEEFEAMLGSKEWSTTTEQGTP
ncbi:MAG: EAL domain-containing protein [Gammaproteobacteria bacterium]|nr:EAL domain-containing protein [Gammaproteobacteria bacterium]MDP2142468.1 EAL domain-containing protein [Gammaproteobacteria bacterium]MDP2346473.1 EAL domain-containing protein [Gammaproteobacteria bacterium]